MSLLYFSLSNYNNYKELFAKTNVKRKRRLTADNVNGNTQNPKCQNSQ